MAFWAVLATESPPRKISESYFRACGIYSSIADFFPFFLSILFVPQILLRILGKLCILSLGIYAYSNFSNSWLISEPVNGTHIEKYSALDGWLETWTLELDCPDLLICQLCYLRIFSKLLPLSVPLFHCL